MASQQVARSEPIWSAKLAAALTLRAIVLVTFVSIVGCVQQDSARPGALSGTILDEDGLPLAGATVRLQGTNTLMTTGTDGRYRFADIANINGPNITAWKNGYYIGGAPLAMDAPEQEIRLKPLPMTTDEAYQWLPARNASRAISPEESGKACEVCHAGDNLPVVLEWERSAHGRSATNPFFLSLFNGKGMPLIPALGYRKDFPVSSGNCSNCHVPALALRLPYDADPNLAAGVEREGVLCDLCHKIKTASADLDGGRAGVLSMTFTKPPKGEQVFIGTLDDVPTGADTFDPFYRESRYCAGCHHGLFWGVLAYSEFAEWQSSEAAAKGIQCQGCHMKPDGKTRLFAVASEGAILRDPATIPAHTFPGRDDLQFMRSGIVSHADARVESDRLRVEVTLRNNVGGHHVPTGSPMRNLVLVVEGRDQLGRALDLIEGGKVPIWGGEGAQEFGNYAGLPGKGYAKVLITPPSYPADPTLGDRRPVIYPAPHWRRIVVESDNRLPAGGEDMTAYVFRLGVDVTAGHVRVRLLHRRSFRSWFESQANFEGDLMLVDWTAQFQR